MPYTLSHPAVVLPFSRFLIRLRVLSATVIGSMVPDFGYLMPVPPPRPETHSAISLLTFSLPVGLLAYWIFQRLIKTPLLNVLPDQAYMRWRPCSAPAAIGSLRQWLLAVCGILAGAVTHLVWDGFTHARARGMRMVPELGDWTLRVHGHHMMAAPLLEAGSSVLGLAVVLGFIAYALRRGNPQAVAPRTLSRLERRMWVLLYALAVVAFTFAFHLLVPLRGPRLFRIILHINIAAIAFLRGLVLSLVVVSLFLNNRLRAKD